MDFSASAATKDAARIWRRRSCTPPRFPSTLPGGNQFHGVAGPNHSVKERGVHRHTIHLPTEAHDTGLRCPKLFATNQPRGFAARDLNLDISLLGKRGDPSEQACVASGASIGLRPAQARGTFDPCRSGA